MIGEFYNLEIDQDEGVGKQQEGAVPFKDPIGNQNILQLKDNIIPKGFLPMEKLFNADDVAKNPKKVDLEEYLDDYNLGIDQ